MENEEIEILKLNVQNAISKRQMIISLFALVVSGTIGLLFLDKSFVKYLLMGLGFYYTFILILNYLSNESKLNQMLKRKREKNG